MQFRKIFFLDDNGPQATETQNDIPGNWWLNVIAIQSEIAQTRYTVVDVVVHSLNGNRTDVGPINTCKCTKKINVTGLKKNDRNISFQKVHSKKGKLQQTYF